MWGATTDLVEFSGFPYGIYTIPEISMVGYTEQQLTQQKIPYEMGIARYVHTTTRGRSWHYLGLGLTGCAWLDGVGGRYDELAKGQMVGGASGMLKILFHAETLKVL